MAKRKTDGNKDSVALICTKLVLPIASELELLLWDLKYEKEGAQWYLRVYIDKDEGAVTIDDCVDVSRKLNKVLDEVDPISETYCLQVSSPGVERELRKPEHFEKYIGEIIEIKLFKPMENKKVFQGILQDYQEDTVYISKLGIDGDDGGEVEVIGFDKKEVSRVKVVGFLEDFDDENFDDFDDNIDEFEQ